MADVHSKETRSYNMSRICSKDTKPEMLVRKFLQRLIYLFDDDLLPRDRSAHYLSNLWSEDK